MIIRKSLPTEENGSNHSRSEIPSCIGGDSIDSESPDHASVCETDGEWDGDRADEWIRRVQTRPNNHGDETINHEFLEKYEALIRLVRVREGTQDGRSAAIEDRGTMGSYISVAESGDLGPVATHEDEAGDEGT